MLAFTPASSGMFDSGDTKMVMRKLTNIWAKPGADDKQINTHAYCSINKQQQDIFHGLLTDIQYEFLVMPVDLIRFASLEITSIPCQAWNDMIGTISFYYSGIQESSTLSSYGYDKSFVDKYFG
jgi:hypothetical protein